MTRISAFLFPALLFTGVGIANGQNEVQRDRGSVSAPNLESLVEATPAEVRLQAHADRNRLRQISPFQQIPFRNVGPTIMSGRIVDVEVNPIDPTHMYVAYASGGLWETTNNGVSFKPILDREATMTLGDIAVSWETGEIWAGTGENNSSRSSYAGTGVYSSTDGGVTWESKGLANSHRIGRIRIHPGDPQTIWVAAIGPLYSSGGERGIYKSTDGGNSWRRVLHAGSDAGAIDLELDPSNPDVMYAATWHRERRAWDFVESGSASGVYKSVDGGENWSLLSGPLSGLPDGEGLGRVGIAIAPSNPQQIYALVDNQYRRPSDDEEEDGLSRESLREMDAATFAKIKDEDLEDFLRSNSFPEKYTVQDVRSRVASGEIEPSALVDYLEDANSLLFDTDVIGAELYVSIDGGGSWTKTHTEYLDRIYNTYGYYFGQVRVSPSDASRVYVMGVPLVASSDGGKTFGRIDGPHVHVDHHALWINPANPRHLVNGNDGGLNISYDDGETWVKANAPPVGQFYTVQVDQEEPYNIYGGLQDNGVWWGPSTYEHSYRWHASGDYPYKRLLGGDGMQVEVDTRDNDLVYSGFQFGFYYRINRNTGKTTSIRPKHELGERPLRFNWQSPIHLSRHNQDILYFGSNKLHRSLDRGQTWQAISEDLTFGGRPGDVPFGTLTTIDESPLQFGLIYVGTDDGRVHVTENGGSTWSDISTGLPDDLWISRVEASAHDANRLFVTLNGYRWDHFESYVYESGDKGKTWVRIGTNIPNEPVNVVVEDPEAENVLFVGTDHAVYVSVDRGASFVAMDGGLPDAPMHDLKIQNREGHLVVGTHGRSIYLADINPIREYAAIEGSEVYVFDTEDVRHNPNWGSRGAVWMEYSEPVVDIAFYSREAGEVELQILTESGTKVHEWKEQATPGINFSPYDLTATDNMRRLNRWLRGEGHAETEVADNGKVYLGPGRYAVRVKKGKEADEGVLVVEGRGQAASPEPAAGPRPAARYRIK